MTVSQVIIGTSLSKIGIEPDHYETFITLPTLGLFKRDYNGYFNDDVNWFDTQTPTGTDQDTTLNIGDIPDEFDNFSKQWTGYFYCNATGNYRFFTTSDDASYLWLGLSALSGYTIGNAIVDNGGPHGSQVVGSVHYKLTSGRYYPR